MKKTLTQTTLILFVLACSLNVAGQSNRLSRSAGKQQISSASVRMPGHRAHSALKNSGNVLLPAALSGFYREDFEGSLFPPAGWQAIDVLDPVNVWDLSNVSPFTGTQSAYMVYSAIGVDGEDWLILPQFTVAATDSFSFWLEPQFIGFPPDSTIILVSTTDSAITSFTTVIGTLAEGDNYPLTAVYQYYSFSLSAFAGQDVYVAIQNKNTYGDGIYIDHVAIGTKPPINATAVSIDMARYIPIGTVSPTATFLNDGDSTQSFPVTMTITNGYSSTKNVTSLAAGATQQITFDPWITVSPNTEIISIQAQLTGDGFVGDDSIAASIMVLEPFTNYGWTSKAPMSITRFDAPSAAINRNDTSYLFAFSGISAGLIVPDAEKYFPYSNSWAAVSTMNNGNFTSSAASFNNKIYVIGGYNPAFVPVGDNQVYDVATDSWSAGAAMPIPVGDYAFGVYKDSLFYYVGGYDGTVDEDLVQIYNPATDTWTNGTNIPAAAAAWRGGIVGNKIIVTAGYNQVTLILATTYVGDIDAADPTLITWTAWDDYPAGTNARMGGGATLDTASALVIFTGGDPTGQGIDALDATFAFDLNTNTWKIGPPKITPANNITNLTAIVDNDSLYMAAVGGLNSTGELDVNEWLNLGPYTITTNIDDHDQPGFNISCYPNPFVKTTDIKFSLSQSSFVKAEIRDVTGNEIETLCNKNLAKGNHLLKWDAAKYSKGVYFCTLYVNEAPLTLKLLKY